jgi:metallo-beta-lactamase family protein
VSHEVAVLPDERSTVLVVGYQAAGSLGRRLIEGQKKVTIRGKTVPVHARVETMYGYSAHMDGEQLLEFVNTMSDSLAEVFVAMGEPASSSFLVQRIRDYLGLKASAPEVGQSAQIEL